MASPRTLVLRSTTALAGIAVVAALAGCASTTAGRGTGAAAGGGAAPVAVTSGAAPQLTTVAAQVASAVAAATSVHVHATAPGLPVLALAGGAVDGDVTLANGVPSGFAFTAGSYALRWVDGVGYAELPGAAAATPWTKLSATSTDPLQAGIAQALAKLSSGLTGIDPTALLGAASGFHALGASTVDGTAVTGYGFDVDPATLAKALGVGQLPTGATTTGPVPVQVFLDGQGRPVRVTAAPGGDSSKGVTVDLSAWDAPVTVAAPPADQVGG